MVTGPTLLKSGDSATLTAMVRESDGTSKNAFGAGVVWVSSQPAVVTIAGDGRISASAGMTGTVTITATLGNVSGQLTVTVIANVAGSWFGEYRVDSCDQAGAVASANWCGTLFPRGRLLPIQLQLIQNDYAINGRITFGELAGDAAGMLTTDNRINLSGDFTYNQDGALFGVAVGQWESKVSSPNGMTGTFALNIRAIGFPGNAFVAATITVLSRTR